MEDGKRLHYIKDVLGNMPADWLSLTTHRLDIYEEELAKTQFLDQFEKLVLEHHSSPSIIGTAALSELPTAYDYIRLGHPLSCLLEWAIAAKYNVKPDSVISFSSSSIPVLAILRKNLFDNKKTQILFKDDLPEHFNVEVLRQVYGYHFELKKVESVEELPEFEGSTIFVTGEADMSTIIRTLPKPKGIDFYVNVYAQLGSVVIVNSAADHSSGKHNESYISDIQHVRRRETIAMTPANCHAALKMLVEQTTVEQRPQRTVDMNKKNVLDLISGITGTRTKALLGSCGLSIQYGIMMGLIHDAQEKHQGKAIKIIVPPNCYGGTNDQARRVAACIDHVEIVDLPVDGDNDMVQSIDLVLNKLANEDAVPYIIAEIPTNPRVEVPDLVELKKVLSVVRETESGHTAIDPVFILDQTFCPNVHFLGDDDILSTVRTISYVSGSKFPSGGLCTAGYCVANKKAESLMEKVELHLKLCDNEATDLQIEILTEQLPSMKKRIHDAYQNTREFVKHISKVLPEAKINFVSEDLARQGFMPSVFSLDLPTKGQTDEERETYKRELNHKLIKLMISEIPDESKHCVSYGQLKGCYWTIPATSTQGTTKEGDKDYIARVALSPHMDIERHKHVFLDFVESI